MSSEMITLRVTPEQKAKLETLANQQGGSVSDVIRRWIDKNEVTVEVPEEYADIVSLCALLKGQTVSAFFTDFLDSVSIGEHFWSILAEKIKLLLKEKGRLTEEELVAELPERVCRDLDMDAFMRCCLYRTVQKTDDGKYELKKEQS